MGASTWAGSYHILEMGRHYQDYVLNGQMPSLTPLSVIPAACPYQRLTTKIRASGVTGNIGEVIASIFARRVLKADVADIAHLEIRGKRVKTPDYLMRIGTRLQPALSALNAAKLLSGGPDWWPVESKARASKTAASGARRDAFQQLVAYWSLLATSRQMGVGYGLIVTFTYQPLREVCVSVIVPKNRQPLIDLLRDSIATEVAVDEIWPHLYGC